MADLDTLTGSGNSLAFGINNFGQVVGESNAEHWNSRAFLYRGGVMTDLGTLSGGNGSAAFAINDLGQITGQSDVTGSILGHPFLYRNGMMDRGTLGGLNSAGTGINNAGEVNGGPEPQTGSHTRFFLIMASWLTSALLGASTTSDGIPHPFLYSDGVMKDPGFVPGTFGATAEGMNNAGEVVGMLVVTNGFDAFIYSDGVMTDLNSVIVNSLSARILSQAAGINDLGQNIATSTNSLFGPEKAFLLMPVPEPGTLLMAIGALALLICRRA